jgi:hypothetical protein
VAAHEGESCADVGAGFGDSLSQYVHHITDSILNLTCPSCAAAFIDFDGCCAVKCGTCSKYFCGFCLCAHAESSTSHAHVRTCALNPAKGEYFCPAAQLDQIHRQTRIQALRRYFDTSVPKGDAKRRVMKQVEVILADLHISKEDLFGREG